VRGLTGGGVEERFLEGLRERTVGSMARWGARAVDVVAKVVVWAELGRGVGVGMGCEVSSRARFPRMDGMLLVKYIVRTSGGVESL
jgi:hypothetical protein